MEVGNGQQERRGVGRIGACISGSPDDDVGSSRKLARTSVDRSVCPADQ